MTFLFQSAEHSIVSPVYSGASSKYSIFGIVSNSSSCMLLFDSSDFYFGLIGPNYLIIIERGLIIVWVFKLFQSKLLKKLWDLI